MVCTINFHFKQLSKRQIDENREELMNSDLWAKSFIIKEEVSWKIIVIDPYVINNMEITNLLTNHIK